MEAVVSACRPVLTKKSYDNIVFSRSCRRHEASHSSEIRGLSSTKCSRETLQNLLYFMYKIDIDQGIHKEKSKVARNEKRKKLRGFSYT